MVEEEQAVEPGSKKRKVCSSVQSPCKRAPMRLCARAVPSMLALWATCAAVTGLREEVLREVDGCHPCAEAVANSARHAVSHACRCAAVRAG